MKTLFLKTLCSLCMIGLLSCDDEIDKVAPQVVVQFHHLNQTLSEDSNEGYNVMLILNQDAADNGTVMLTMPENMLQRVQTNPAHSNGVITLAVTKGSSQLQFEVRAINNTLVEGNQTITFSIQSAPGFILGDKKTFDLLIEDDDSDNEEETPVLSTVNFDTNQQSLLENSVESLVYRITFTPAVTQPSSVVVNITSDNTQRFVTNPASVNNTITLHAPVGTTSLTVTLDGVNNADFDGNSQVEFTIANTTGSLIKGAHVKQTSTIIDDELRGKIKGYEVYAPEGSEKRTYQYDLKGRIAKIITEQNAAHNPITLTDTFFYDAQDRVTKINKWLGRDILYTWNNNKIVRAEVYQDDKLIQYANYDYDELDNLVGVEPFYKQNDGSFKMSGVTVYLYFEDGNLYKSLTYNNPENDQEPVLHITRTYENYLNANSPISMFEFLPTVQLQNQLAGTYRFENHSIQQDITYQLSYEFNEDGFLSKRIASAPGETQTTNYYYY